MIQVSVFRFSVLDFKCMHKQIAVADPGGIEETMAPPDLVKISHKKDGC